MLEEFLLKPVLEGTFLEVPQVFRRWICSGKKRDATTLSLSSRTICVIPVVGNGLFLEFKQRSAIN